MDQFLSKNGNTVFKKDGIVGTVFFHDEITGGIKVKLEEIGWKFVIDGYFEGPFSSEHEALCAAEEYIDSK